MTLAPYRRHVPFVAIDGTKCITCGQLPNDYSRHLRLIAVDPKTWKMYYEGDKVPPELLAAFRKGEHNGA